MTTPMKIFLFVFVAKPQILNGVPIRTLLTFTAIPLLSGFAMIAMRTIGRISKLVSPAEHLVKRLQIKYRERDCMAMRSGLAAWSYCSG